MNLVSYRIRWGLYALQVDKDGRIQELRATTSANFSNGVI
jgi:hypothetical protein